MQPQSPNAGATEAARNRYANSFTSSIFQPMKAPEAPSFTPAGKRRDQSTAELFGDYNDKELHAAPKTFVPKEDYSTARQKKLNFLSSDVLPKTAYRQQQQGGGGGGGYPGQADVNPYDDNECEERINPNARRQLELSSEMFGRETPAQTAEEVNDARKRLTPSDFKWFSVPEPVQSVTGGQDVTYQDRAYYEKCSNLFDHQSPKVRQQTQGERDDIADESMGDLKRRANVYYSDMFGRKTPMDEPERGQEVRRGKLMSNAEDQICVHQDWTDSRTEKMLGAGGPKSESPTARKSDEFNQSRIFAGKDQYRPPSSRTPVNFDNSSKVKAPIGRSTQEIHQAHLRTSLTPSEFYDEAAGTKHWEVIELHISGLRDDADEGTVKNLCNGFDLQIVKVNVEMDPVRNLCKGRAKIMVRYNPLRDSIAGLVSKLQETKLRVEL